MGSTTGNRRLKRTCLSPGDKILNDEYEILKCIHSKGMANVYIVQDINLGRQWCLKEIRISESGAKSIEYISLLQEIKILNGLNHERVPRIVKTATEGDSLFVIMDFLDGINLKDYVMKIGKIPESKAVEWMIQIVQTMAYLHSNRGKKKPIFYRDMKPDNLMVRPNGKINIFDFGISVEVKSANQLPEFTLGTNGYVAPEQKKKNVPVDLRSDIYAMGKTFYFMLTGIDPRSNINGVLPNINEVSPEISPTLVQIIYKCMEEEPKNRYQDCEELQYALENYKYSDDKYKSKIRKKIIFTSVTFTLSIVMMVGSIIPFNLNTKKAQDTYERALAVARQSGKVEDYDKAISLNPLVIEPYLEYIDSIKEDGVFSTQEEKLFLNNINPNLLEIKEDDNFGQLAFEIGRLYWFYYEDKNDSGKTLSIKWFEDAIFNNYNSEEAVVYYNLGKFNRDISKSIKDASDRGMYKSYWDNLLIIQGISKSDIVTIQTYISIAECISTYAYNLKKDGVSYEEIMTEIDTLNKFLDSYEVDEYSLDVIQGLYSELENLVSGLDNRVDIAYNVVEKESDVEGGTE